MLIVRKKASPLQIITLLLVFTVSFFIGKFIADWGFFKGPETTTAGDTNTSEGLPVNRLNILLLGIDARPGEKDARTDTIMLVSIDRDTKKIAMVSIPRDTLVEIPGHGENRINLANVYGGAELARETVEGLLGVEIPYYIKTNFEGFKEIIDTLGGVDIDVEKRMYYPTEGINLKPGPQKLDGENALGYVRFRHDALGDIGRTERQQKFLSALAKEMMRARAIIKAPFLVPKLMAAVETNLGAGDAILFARAVSNMGSDNIMTATLPGTFYNYKGASYWKIDEAQAKIVLTDLFRGVKLATITGPDINVPENKPARKPKPAPSAEIKEKNPDEDTQNAGDQNPDGQDGTTQPPPDGGSQPGQDSGAGTGSVPPDSDTTGQTPGQNTGGTQTPGTQTPGGTTSTGGQQPGQTTNTGGQQSGQTGTTTGTSQG